MMSTRCDGGVAMEDVAGLISPTCKRAGRLATRYCCGALGHMTASRAGEVFCLDRRRREQAAARNHREGPRPGSRPHLPGPGRLPEARRTTMRTKRIGAARRRLPRWLRGSPPAAGPGMGSALPGLGKRPPGPTARPFTPRQRTDTAPAPASMTATAAGPTVTRQLARARLATAKYATNLARAKADGYQVIAPDDAGHGDSLHEPRHPGIHHHQAADPGLRAPREHLAARRPEWVFPSMPKTPPLQDASVRLLPGGLPLQGRHVPSRTENSKTCTKTNPKTGSSSASGIPT